MRKQQRVWLKEHSTSGALPGISGDDPSGALLNLVDYLKDRGVPLAGKAVDVGCGKGRNSFYLASLGFQVDALDYIEPALAAAKLAAHSKGLADKITFNQTEIDKKWPFPDENFDLAVDSYSSIDIETLEGRQTCRNEMFRTLKSGGYALVTVCSADDEWEKEAIAKYPGPEPNSTVWPQNGKFQKDYDEPELREFYKEFEIVRLKKVSKEVFKLGKTGVATNFWLFLRKPVT